MARFPIISQSDSSVIRYEGTPVYNGAYMKPAYVEYREISSPMPIDWEVGDYVDYTRTGLRYKLYTKPQIMKQARANSCGGAFVYQNVQFYERTKDFDICPFRDLVLSDNDIHFSTQQSISTFEDVGGIARRIQACLDDMYDDWEVRVVSSDAVEDAEFMAMITEPRDFTVSGVTILGALEKIYSVWPLCGWTYSVEGTKNILTIGGANIASAKNAAESFTYGKGNGLKNIRKRYTNADELATRIYAYGSSRNMIARYYNNITTIKDHDSVDIANLMLPIEGVDASYTGWGMTDGKRDANKAFIENESATEEIGLRPTTAYFDGSGDLQEIYPSIEGVTIGDLRSAMASSDDYYPKSSWQAAQRLDEVVSAGTIDDGQKSTDGSKYVISASEDDYSYAGTSVLAGQQIDIMSLASQSAISGKISFTSGITGTISIVSGNMTPKLTLSLLASGSAGRTIDVKLTGSPSTGYSFEVPSLSASVEDMTNAQFYIHVMANEVVDPSQDAGTPIFDISMSGACSAGLEKEPKKKFTVKIPQIGFNIEAQAALGNGKSLSIKTGKNAGRTFEIDTCVYSASDDSWNLTLWRTEDTSLGIYFPNTDYPIEAGDKYVLLDIAMPELYIKTASIRLLTAARELLSRLSTLQPFYEPEIDAIFMAEHSRVIKEGEYMAFSDADIVPAGEVMLIDSVTISENEAIIPTYKVTLRERKKITWTQSVERSINEVSTKSGSSTSGSTGGQKIDLSEYALASDVDALANMLSNLYVAGTKVRNSAANDTLLGITAISNLLSSDSSDKSRIVWDDNKKAWHFLGNMYADGWVSALGAGSGSGGGGGADLTDVWASLTTNTDSYKDLGIDWGHIDLSLEVSGTGNVVSGLALVVDPLDNTKAKIVYTKTNVSSAWEAITGKPTTIAGYGITDAKIENGTITLGSASITPITSHQSLAGYVPTSREVNGHALTDDITISKSDVGLGNVENTKLSTWTGSNKIVTVGTITTGTWNGTPIANAYLANNSITIGSKEIALGGSATLAQLGIPSWALAASKPSYSFSEITGKVGASQLPALYIGTTQAQSSSAAQALTGISSVKLTSDASLFEWDEDNGAWHFHGNLYADGWVSALGAGSGSGGGGGADLPAVWESLSKNEAPYANQKIDPHHLNIPVSQGSGTYVTGVSWDTTAGILYVTRAAKPSYAFSEITGTATASQLPNIESLTNFSTRVYDATVSRTKNHVLAAPSTANGAATFRALVASDIPDLSSTYQTKYGFTISGTNGKTYNLATIATQAANGNTAYGWGNHANAGYARQQAENNLVHSSNEITMVPSEFSGPLWFNYRTTGGHNGNITYYDFGNGNKGHAAVVASKFVVDGGTSSQFLKADGSVDSNTYLTTGAAASTYLPLAGGTMDSPKALRFSYATNDLVTISTSTGDYANNYAFSPYAYEAWHDHFAFLREHTLRDVQVSANGTSWAASSKDLRPLFNHRENKNVTILEPSERALRFTLYSTAFHVCGVRYISFGVPYIYTFSNFTVLAEVSADGSSWTTTGTCTITKVQANNVLTIGTAWDGFYYLRLTFTKTTNLTTGSVVLNTIYGLTVRKGDQGLGKENSLPFDWDTAMDILPASSDAQLGTSSIRWKAVYSLGGDFSGNVRARLSLSSTSWVTDSCQFMAGATGTNYTLGMAATTNGYGVIQSANVGTGAIPLLINPSGGNVGIGVTNPQYKLDVNGTARITTSLRIGDATISWDSTNSALHIDKPIYSDSWVSALGAGSGSGGGGDGASLPAVWESLSGHTDEYKDTTIDWAHIKVNRSALGSGNVVSEVALAPASDGKSATLTITKTNMTEFSTVYEKDVTITI